MVGVVFDFGPHNQPGESSAATCNKLKGNADNNQYIYIVFPDSYRYLKQLIGTKGNSEGLKRNPTNTDVKQAYALMNRQRSATGRKATKEVLLWTLSDIPVVQSFDNATPQEKAWGRQQPSNNNRNLND